MERAKDGHDAAPARFARQQHRAAGRSAWTSTSPILATGEPMQRRSFVKQLALSAALAGIGLTAVPVHAADTIKVGILHSLSGTMAISETSLKDVALMTIDEINKKGGVMGRKLEPVLVD